MRWALAWLWLHVCLFLHSDGERQVRWAMPRVVGALRRIEAIERNLRGGR